MDLDSLTSNLLPLGNEERKGNQNSRTNNGEINNFINFIFFLCTYKIPEFLMYDNSSLTLYIICNYVSGLNLNNFWELFSKLFLNWPWGKQSKYIIINRQKWKPLKDIQGIYIRPVSVILPLYPFFSTWRLPFVEAFLCSKFVCRKYEPDVIR